jgi:RHS repeat-associated protein
VDGTVVANCVGFVSAALGRGVGVFAGGDDPEQLATASKTDVKHKETTTNTLARFMAITPLWAPKNHFKSQIARDAAGNTYILSAPFSPADKEIGLLFDARNPATGQEFDAEGRLAWIDYNKFDQDTSSDLVYYDFNGDCIVDGRDVAAFSPHYNKNIQMDGNWDARFDLTNNGVVNGQDVAKMNTAYATTCPHFIYDYVGNLVRVASNAAGTPSPFAKTLLGGIYERKADGTVTKYYNFDGRRVAMSVQPSGGSVTTYYLAMDHHGDTAYVLNATGTVLSHTRYYPYGQIWTQEGSAVTDKMFDGYTKLGQISGLNYAGARFYSADLGLFLSRDPIPGYPANLPSLNPYMYVRANPESARDPSGSVLEPEIGGGGGGGWGEGAGYGFFMEGDEWTWESAAEADTPAEYVEEPTGAYEPEAGYTEEFSDVGADNVQTGYVEAKKWPAAKLGSAGGPTAGGRFSWTVRKAAWNAEDNPGRVCFYCRQSADEVDHIIPRSRGGNATLDNAQLVCKFCNASKGNRSFPVNAPPGFEGDWPPPWWHNIQAGEQQ